MKTWRRQKNTLAENRDGAVLTEISVTRNDAKILNLPELWLSEQRIGIVGRNGSGKSTLARIICGLINSDAGNVVVNGVDMIKDRKSAIGAVGMLFQNPDHQIIFPTVQEEIAFGMTQLGHTKSAAKSAVDKMLADFGKSDWANRSVHTLSQGQRHLVCLMAVLIMEPGLIVLDEPFAGLDIPTTNILLRHINAVTQQIVHITHQPDTLTGYDRVIWLEHGEIEMDGPPTDVLTAFCERMEGIDDFSDLAD